MFGTTGANSLSHIKAFLSSCVYTLRHCEEVWHLVCLLGTLTVGRLMQLAIISRCSKYDYWFKHHVSAYVVCLSICYCFISAWAFALRETSAAHCAQCPLSDFVFTVLFCCCFRLCPTKCRLRVLQQCYLHPCAAPAAAACWYRQELQLQLDVLSIVLNRLDQLLLP